MRYDSKTLRRLQLLELQMLKDIDEVCTRFGIPYFLDSGSALGANRHEGFIPWDDDVDIGMLRAEYERFLDEAAPILEERGYEIVNPHNSDVIACQFTKVMKRGTAFSTQETRDAGFDQGVFIDVFPYDYLSADPGIAEKQIKKCLFWQRVSYLYHSPNIYMPHKGVLGACERAACWVLHGIVRLFFNPQKITRRFDEWALKGAADPSDRVITFTYPIKDGFEVEWLLPAQDMTFESNRFPVPRDMESYLTYIYGDWRALPPEDQRTNHAPLKLDLG